MGPLSLLHVPFCSNPYINAVFVHYAGKFEKMGAMFQHDIQIGDEELPYIELCRILTERFMKGY